jgi:hypothetical protein
MPFSTFEVAKILGVTEQSLLRLTWAGLVTPGRVGRKTLAWSEEHIAEARSALADKIKVKG